MTMRLVCHFSLELKSIEMKTPASSEMIDGLKRDNFKRSTKADSFTPGDEW